MPDTPSQDSGNARRIFPAGLLQPAGCYRFSVDALLLAAFAAKLRQGRNTRFADLGTGCGVVGLAFLLLMNAECSGTGFECTPKLTAAAMENALRLGLAGQFTVRTADLEKPEERLRIRGCGPVDLVMANPPWRLLGTGRLPTTPERRKALFGTAETLPAFAACAAALLGPGGTFAAVISPDRLPALRTALLEADLHPHTFLSISTTPGSPPGFVLTGASRGRPAAFPEKKNLMLHDTHRFYTPEALEFCPFLR